MFYFKNKFFNYNLFIYFLGYLNCIFICNYEYINIININFLYNFFLNKIKYLFISIDIKRDNFINYLLRPINKNFLLYILKKNNYFFLKLFEINFKNYFFDHTILLFLNLFKNKIYFFSNYFYFKKYKLLNFNYNLDFNLQFYFFFFNLFCNIIFLYFINF